MTSLATILVALAFVTVFFEGRSTGTPIIQPKNEYFDKNIPDTETKFTAEDFENAKKLPREGKPTTTKRDNHAMENPKLFEGDIANKGLNSSTIARFLGQVNPNDTKGVVRNAQRGGYSRWPGAIIPYTISAQYTAAARSVMLDAMNQFGLRSCIKFIPRTAEIDYVHISPETGCNSHVGRIGGRQVLSLGENCIDRAVIIHELMHAIGFWHEQSRPDRDQYVEVLFQNIQEAFKFAFDKYSVEQIDYLGQPYDYDSIMHYGPNLFSTNGQDTIRPVASARARGVTLKQVVGNRLFSDIDIKELNAIAQCSGGVAPTTRTLPANCLDIATSCISWANSGYCNTGSIYEPYMAINCKRTCAKC